MYNTIICKFSGASSVSNHDSTGTEGEDTSLSDETNIVIKTETLDLPVESLPHHPRDGFQANLPSHSSYEPSHLVKEETTITKIDLRSDSNSEISVKQVEYSPSPPRVVIERDSTPEIFTEQDSTPETVTERDSTPKMLSDTPRIKTKSRVRKEPQTILEALQWTDSESSDSEGDQEQDNWKEKENEKEKRKEDMNIKPHGEKHDAYGSVSDIPEMISSEPVLENTIDDLLSDSDRAEKDGSDPKDTNGSEPMDTHGSHLKVTTGSEPKPGQGLDLKTVKHCDYCEKYFYNNRSYGQHIKSHIIKCQLCSKIDKGMYMR